MTTSYDPQADRRADRALKRLAEAEIAVAKALVPLHASKSYTKDCSSNCSSKIGQYAERRGVDSRTAWRLFRLGQALAAQEGLEEKVRDKVVPPANAAAIGKVLADPSLLEPGDDWEGLAETGSKRAVQDAVQERVEKKRQKAPRTYALGFHVTKDAREAYEKLRKLLSRKRKKHQTPGQVFAFAVESGLELVDPDHRDPNRRAPRKRRAGPTSEKPQSRYVPASVERALHERSGDCCEFPGCENDIFLEKSHGYPKRRGGGQELDDLAKLCSMHHKLRDKGDFWQVGWTSLGKPVFQHRSGEVHWPRGSIRAGGEGRKGRKTRRKKPPDRVAERGETYRASRRTKSPPGRAEGRTRSRESRAPPEKR